MLKVPRSGARQQFARGSLKISRVRPGIIRFPSADPVSRSLSVFDRASLDFGTVVHLHKHVNDENLSYMWRGASWSLHSKQQGLGVIADEHPFRAAVSSVEKLRSFR